MTPRRVLRGGGAPGVLAPVSLPFAPLPAQRAAAAALAAEFPLDVLVDAAAQDECRKRLVACLPDAARALERLSDAVRADGLGVLRPVAVGSDQLMVAVTAWLGRVVAQPDRAAPQRPRLLWEVRPMAREENVGSYATRGPDALAPHTESPIQEHPDRYLALGCVANPAGSGECTLVRVDELVAELDPHEVALLHDPVFPFVSRQPQLPARVAAVLRTAERAGAPPRIRYFADGLAAGLARPELRPSPAHCAALERLSSMVHDPAGWTLLHLRAGDLLLVDNHRVLHGRSEIIGRGRHLRRLLAT